MGQGIYFSAHSGEVTLHSHVLVGDTPRVGVTTSGCSLDAGDQSTTQERGAQPWENGMEKSVVRRSPWASNGEMRVHGS